MYIITVHFGGGSMVEAAQPEYILGPYATHTAAMEEIEWFYTQLDTADLHPSVKREYWAQTVELPTGKTMIECWEGIKEAHG